MSKFNFLICDDSQEKVDTISKVLKKDTFVIERVYNYEELLEALAKENTYDAIFVDLYFNTDKYGGSLDGTKSKILSLSDFKEIKKKTKNYQKIIVYTKYTNEEIDLLRELFSNGLISEWIDHEDIYSKASVRYEEAVLRIQKTIGLQSEIREGLWILHFSDLHFGRQFYYAGKEVGVSLSRLIEDQIRTISKGQNKLGIDNLPPLIVISGDLTNEASENQFLSAIKFINDIKGSLEKVFVKNPISVIAPGNHDLSWRLSVVDERKVVFDKKKNKPTIVAIKKEEEKKEFCEFKWKPYERYITEANAQTDHSNEAQWWYHDLRERFEMRVFVLNSSYEITYANNKPKITTDTIDNIEKVVGFDDSCAGLLVVHHPVSTWGDGDTNIQKDLLNYFRNRLGIKFILSGHKHSSQIIEHRLGSEKILEIQTGSTSLSPEALKFPELPNFRILNFEMSDAKTWKGVKAWNFIYKDNQFKPEAVDADGVYHESASIE